MSEVSEVNKANESTNEVSNEVSNEETNEVQNKTSAESCIFDSVAIKGKFKFQSTGIFGIFGVILRTDLDPHKYYDTQEFNPFIELHIAVSYFSDMYHIDLEQPWNALEVLFNDIIIKGNHALTATNSFQKGLREVFRESPDTGIRIVNDFKKKNYKNIEREFDNIFTILHKDRQADIELIFEDLNSVNLMSTKKARAEIETPQENEDILTTPAISVNPLHFSIPATPIFAPIGEGIPSNQLSQGVRILMKLDTNSEYGQEWIDIFKAYDKNEKKVLPIIGTVSQIGPVIKNNIDIIVKYQEEQYTKFNVESGIKLKLFNPTDPGIHVIDPLATTIETIAIPSKTYAQLFNDRSFRTTLTIGLILLLISIVAYYFNL